MSGLVHDTGSVRHRCWRVRCTPRVQNLIETILGDLTPGLPAISKGMSLKRIDTRVPFGDIFQLSLAVRSGRRSNQHFVQEKLFKRSDPT